MSKTPEGSIMTNCWCGGEAVVPEPDPISGVAIPGRCLDSDLHDPFADGRRASHSVLYVAGPMSGYPSANYPAFNEAAQRLDGAGYTVVNPVDVHAPEQCHYVDLLREDLVMLLSSHGVAVLEGWWESTGARNEVQVAGLLKMPVRPVSDWLSRAALELARSY